MSFKNNKELKKITPPSYFSNCKKILEIQKSKMKKLKKEVSGKYFYNTDVDTKEVDEESTCLLKEEETYADKECDLVNKIMKDNSNKLRKIERDYQIISRIYDEMGSIAMEQSDDVRKIDTNIGETNKYVGKGNDELLRNLNHNSTTGTNWAIWLVILVTLITLFVFVIFR